MSLFKIFLVTTIAILLIGCGETERPKEVVNVTATVTSPADETTNILTPNFNADSAYSFIQTQLDFGFRIPNTPEHDSCAVWMKQKLTEYGFSLTIQTGKAKAWTGNMLNIV